ncbi:MAG: metal-dependent hydrolase [Victivallales bacterium]|jgi:hypothetical protein|nr:metal-dependent hydrolase [Victivallales bacterium]
MANFRTHMVLGGLWGVFAGFAAFLTNWCNIAQSVVLGVLGMIGAALPDIDGKNARPRQILLGILGVGIPFLLLGSHWHGLTNEARLGWIIGLYVVIRYGTDFFLCHFSRHRGAFHSIPAAILSGEITFLIFVDSSLTVRFAFALSVAGGYISHLLLDELYAWNFIGATEKKSAGNAFTWKTDSAAGTLLFYLIIAIIGYYLLSASKNWKFG